MIGNFLDIGEYMHDSHYTIYLNAHRLILVCSTCCGICAGSYRVLCFQFVCLFVCETLCMFVGHMFTTYPPKGKREEENFIREAMEKI